MGRRAGTELQRESSHNWGGTEGEIINCHDYTINCPVCGRVTNELIQFASCSRESSTLSSSYTYPPTLSLSMWIIIFYRVERLVGRLLEKESQFVVFGN